MAKDNPKMGGVFCFTDEKYIDQWLEKTPVREIWGIGQEKALFLNRNGIINAIRLKKAPDEWVIEAFNSGDIAYGPEESLGEYLAYPLMVQPNKKAIVTSRTFGYEVNGLAEMEEADIGVCGECRREVTKSKFSCRAISRPLLPRIRLKVLITVNSAGIDMTPPTAYTPQLVETAKRLLAKIYKQGYRYKSCGVMLMNLSDEAQAQQDLVQSCL